MKQVGCCSQGSKDPSSLLPQDSPAEVTKDRCKRLALQQAKSMWQKRGRRVEPLSIDVLHQHDTAPTSPWSPPDGPSIHRLPPEVLSLIFQLALPEDEYIRPSTRKAPLLLCQVSCLWRDMATSTPQLWNSISLGRVHRGGAAPWLSRSGQLPLSIELTMSLSAHEDVCSSHRHRQTLALLLPCADRWSRLRLNVPGRLIPHLLRRPMPSLSVLELGSNHAMADVHLPSTLAPMLRHVTLLTTSLDPTPLLHLPWSQLTHFSSRHWADVHGHLAILQRCAGSLVHCQLHALHSGWCHGQSLVASGPDVPLLLPRLRSLEIVACTSTAMVSVLDRLTLPALEELALVVPEESPWGICEWPMSTIHSLVDHSSGGLLRIAFTGMTGEAGYDGSYSKNSAAAVVIEPRSTG